MRNRKQNTNKTQLIVPTPLWLQRRMLKNLQLAACSKVGPARAQRASEILETINKGTNLLDVQTNVEQVRKNVLVDERTSSVKAIRTGALQIVRFFIALAHKLRVFFSNAKAWFHIGFDKVSLRHTLRADMERR